MEELLKKIDRLPDGAVIERVRHWGAGGVDTITGKDLKRLALALRTRMEDDAEPETCLVAPVETREGWGR